MKRSSKHFAFRMQQNLKAEAKKNKKKKSWQNSKRQKKNVFRKAYFGPPVLLSQSSLVFSICCPI